MGAGITTGCQSLLKSPELPTAGTATASSAEAYTVELHSSWGKPKTSRETYTGRVPLQQVVEKSGAARKFRDLEITVVRVSKDSGQMLRLKAKYDPQARSVEPQYDYDILANDHVIIKPSLSSPVSELFNN